MIQAMIIPAVLALMAPFIFTMKGNIEQQAIWQEKSMKNEVKLMALAAALIDEQICTKNLLGTPATSNVTLPGIFFLKADKSDRDIETVAKRIMFPEFLDEARANTNPKYDGSGVQVVRFVPSIAGALPGEAAIAYLEVELKDPNPRQRSIPIYFEYEGVTNKVTKCSARRRHAVCPI
jgi:hypothetical protein